MRRFEKRHGRPIEVALTTALNEQGSINGAARALGINTNTAYFWVLRLGIRIRTVAELPREVA